MPLHWYYRWRYRIRERRRVRQRLSGKWRLPKRFAIFTNHVFGRARFGKYEPRERRWQFLLAAPVLALLLWFIVESFRAWNFFQP